MASIPVPNLTTKHYCSVMTAHRRFSGPRFHQAVVTI